MSKNYCDIHQRHFGRGFAGRGRRRCYECERNAMEERFFDSLYLAMRDYRTVDYVQPMHTADDGSSGIMQVCLKDGQKYTIHFDKA